MPQNSNIHLLLQLVDDRPAAEAGCKADSSWGGARVDGGWGVWGLGGGRVSEEAHMVCLIHLAASLDVVLQHLQDYLLHKG